MYSIFTAAIQFGTLEKYAHSYTHTYSQQNLIEAFGWQLIAANVTNTSRTHNAHSYPTTHHIRFIQQFFSFVRFSSSSSSLQSQLLCVFFFHACLIFVCARYFLIVVASIDTNVFVFFVIDLNIGMRPLNSEIIRKNRK